MTEVRNDRPLHDHSGETEPWTVETLTAHLQSTHGIGGLTGGQLAALLQLHAGLNQAQQHGGTAVSGEDPIYTAALHPRQRLDAAGLHPCHWHPVKDHPGHRALVLTAGNTETLICLEQPDVALVRAAVTRPDEKGQLAALKNEWSARLGPGGAKAVEAAHVAGYALGVEDMQAAVRDYEESPVTAGEVISFLEGLNSGVLPSSAHRAIVEVLGILHDREAV
jgi:hypothetical protein